MQDADNVAALKRWDGAWANLNTLKYVRLRKDGGVKESSWPPKGES